MGRIAFCSASDPPVPTHFFVAWSLCLPSVCHIRAYCVNRLADSNLCALSSPVTHCVRWVLPSDDQRAIPLFNWLTDRFTVKLYATFLSFTLVCFKATTFSVNFCFWASDVFRLNANGVFFQVMSCYLRAITEMDGWRNYVVELNASKRWAFPGALLYSVSLVTTVGESAQVPLSVAYLDLSWTCWTTSCITTFWRVTRCCGCLTSFCTTYGFAIGLRTVATWRKSQGQGEGQLPPPRFGQNAVKIRAKRRKIWAKNWEFFLKYRTKKQKKLSNEYIAQWLQTEEKFFNSQILRLRYCRTLWT